LADVVCLHTKDEIERFLLRNPSLHLYSIGDLDDFFWPHTTWYGLRERGRVQQVVLLYSGQRLPTVLALAEPPTESMRELLRELLRLLPRRFYAHLTEGLADVLASDYRIEPYGAHYKMILIDGSRLADFDRGDAVPLSAADSEELFALYDASYPGNWFMPQMLETGFYFGIRRGSALVSVAGVHVCSQTNRVAALGNITTRPDFRGQGLGTAVTARLCRELRRAGIEQVGLNVKADNHSAITCYEKLGFSRAADYGEYFLQAK
jgi:ribosomal protein S18 acetylase RimI-like enzyme